MPYDLPEGTELELTVEVNESRELSVTAYISMIDLTVNARSTVMNELIDVSNIEAELDIQIERTQNKNNKYRDDEKQNIENTIRGVTTSLRVARTDEDEKRKADKQLRDLKVMLDQIERSKELPQLITEYGKTVKSTKELINELGLESEKTSHEDHLVKMTMEAQKAIEETDKTLLINITEQIKQLGDKVVFSNPEIWSYHFNELINGDKEFTNEKEAAYYIQKGKRAIAAQDLEELKRCYRQLTQLLQTDEQETTKRTFSGIRQ